MFPTRRSQPGASSRSTRWPLSIPALALCATLAPALALGADSIRELTRELAKAVNDNKDDVVLRVAREIADIGGDDAAKSLFDIGIKLTAPKQFNGIAKILAVLAKDDKEAHEYLLSKADRGRFHERIYVSDIAVEMKSNAGAKLIAPMVDTDDERVLRAIIPALAKLNVRESVPPLLELLDRFDKSRRNLLIYHQVRDALWDITGQDFETVEDWNKWWEPVKDRFDPEAAQEGKTRVERKRKGDVPEFAGKKIFSKDALFVIDTSGTMRYVMKDDIPGLSRGDGTDSGGIVQKGSGLTPENARLAKFWSRMEMAKRALLKALRKFSTSASFNVIEFNKHIKMMEKRLVRSTPRTKKKASDWVERMKFVQIPGTDTKEALEKAITMRGVSAIYFLSDGLPSADGLKNDDPMPILDHVESLNRFRRVKIHTFGFNEHPYSAPTQINPELQRANEFLKLLAERTGGTFTVLKVTEEKPPPDFKTES